MTILHLITGLSGGGAEHMVLELASQSNNNTIVVSITNRGQILHKFEENKIKCFFLNVDSFKTLWNGLKSLNEITQDKKDLVFHCHMFHAFALAMIFKVFYKGFPIVFTLHTNSVKQLYRKLFLFSTKIFRKKDIIFSENSKKWYLKNSVVIPNGVDLKKFQNHSFIDHEKPHVPFNFLFLGRLTEPKNPLFLVQLIKKITELGYEDFVINVVGDGELRKELEQRIDEENCSEWISLKGYQKEVSFFLSNADCLIIPSLWEGMPVSIIEAGASRLPVISTPVGSIPDFLNNTNAYLSSLDHFHKSMISVLTDYDHAVEKANNLYDLVKAKYDIKKVYKSHLFLYKQVLKII